MAAVTICSDLDPSKIKSLTVSIDFDYCDTECFWRSLRFLRNIYLHKSHKYKTSNICISGIVSSIISLLKNQCLNTLNPVNRVYWIGKLFLVFIKILYWTLYILIKNLNYTSWIYFDSTKLFNYLSFYSIYETHDM